ARLQADPHAGTVQLDQNVVGEVGDQVQVHHLMRDLRAVRPAGGVRLGDRRFAGARHYGGRPLPIRHEIVIQGGGGGYGENVGRLPQALPQAGGARGGGRQGGGE